jgi:hypothetical protein
MIYIKSMLAFELLLSNVQHEHVVVRVDVIIADFVELNLSIEGFKRNGKQFVATPRISL